MAGWLPSMRPCLAAVKNVSEQRRPPPAAVNSSSLWGSSTSGSSGTSRLIPLAITSMLTTDIL